MATKKRELKFYTIAEYEKEQEYLRSQHKKGWKLEHLTFPGIYRFVACEPEDVIYQLDYHKESLGNQGSYTQMFKDCGWEYLFDFMGYSYVRKSVSRMQGEEEIFCDEASRLNFIGRVFKGRMVPLIILFFLVIIPQTIMQAALMDSDPNRTLFYFYIVMFALYLFIFIRFAIQYRKLKSRLD